MFALHTKWRQGNFQRYMCTNLAIHQKEYEGRYLLSYKKHHNNDLRTFSEDCNTNVLVLFISVSPQIIVAKMSRHIKISEIYKYQFLF